MEMTPTGRHASVAKAMAGSHHSSTVGGKATRGGRLRDRGLVLLAVLWVLTLLALMAATFTRTSRTEVNLARNAMQQLQAEALADSGVHLAVARLGQTIEQGGWALDGRVHSHTLPGGEVRILIADEAGKIDLNGANPELLQALLRALGVGSEASVALADAIVDFRDGDHLHLLNGAEDEDYATAGLAHDAKDAPFEEVAELQQVLGMTPALYRRVAPVLTVHTRGRRPNEATAPPLVVAALRGRVMDEGEASGDAAMLMDQATGAAGSEAAPEERELGGLRSRLGLYEIHAEGRTGDGAVFARTAVVLLTRGGRAPFRILSWRRGERRLFAATPSDVFPDQESQ